ncbi:unnamed protein product [Candidula unifasciata]|uniref:C-type lectin domain-containing protein n=1 Tax=Candidula unifasciata TaxID=100452 RepID=A0A8S4AB98_9EUPU|nr:unnamed protein product [Candidula unifasciata]
MRKMSQLTFFLFAALVSLGACQQCSQGWTYFQGRCYGYGNTATSWASAQVMCQSQGATLAEVSTTEENNFVSAIARTRKGTCVWLGATDIFREGDWKWTNRRDFSNFTNWSGGEPNNLNNVENCLNMFQRLNYRWNDENCNSNCNFICVGPANNHLSAAEVPISK